MTPKVDTFEHDIADEIRRKETTLEEVKAAALKTSELVSVITPQRKIQPLTIVLITLLSASLLGIGGVVYYYFHDSLLPPSAQSVEIPKKDIPKTMADVAKMSPTLGNEIGRFITSVEKKDKGYILSINNYSAVFAYMTRNENAYIDELAMLFTLKESTSTTSLQEKVSASATTTKTVIISTSTQTSTSTKTTPTISTTTLLLSEKTSTTTTSDVPQDEYTSDSKFSDITIANQNMRVYKNEKQHVVYSFIGDTTVLISNTPEGILALKGAILR